MGKTRVNPTDLDGSALSIAVELTRERGYDEIANRLDEWGFGEREWVYAADLYIAKNSLQDADKRMAVKRFEMSLR